MGIPVDKYIKQNGVDFYAVSGFGGVKDENEIWPKTQLHIPHIFGLPDKKQYFSCLEESIEYLVKSGKLNVVDQRKLAEYISENEEYKLKCKKLLNAIGSEIRRAEVQEQISKIIESEPDFPKPMEQVELVLMPKKKRRKPVRVAKCTEEPVRVAKCTEEPVRVAKCTEDFAKPKKSVVQKIGEVIKAKILRFFKP